MKCRLQVSGAVAQDQPELTQVDWSAAQDDAEKLWAKGVSIYGMIGPGGWEKHEIDPDQLLYDGIVLTAKAVTEFFEETNGWESTYLKHEWQVPDRGERATWIKEGNIWVGLTQQDVFAYGIAVE